MEHQARVDDAGDAEDDEAADGGDGGGEERDGAGGGEGGGRALPRIDRAEEGRRGGARAVFTQTSSPITAPRRRDGTHCSSIVGTVGAKSGTPIWYSRTETQKAASSAPESAAA